MKIDSIALLLTLAVLSTLTFSACAKKNAAAPSTGKVSLTVKKV